LLHTREHIADDPFMEILKICVNAQTKGSKYLMQLMSTGDIIQEDFAIYLPKLIKIHGNLSKF